MKPILLNDIEGGFYGAHRNYLSRGSKPVTELQGKQKNPTVDNIRENLGTGSKSTIARLLREWKAKNGLQNDDDGSISSELLSIVKVLWDRLQDKADNKASEYLRESDAKVTQIILAICKPTLLQDMINVMKAEILSR